MQTELNTFFFFFSPLISEEEIQEVVDTLKSGWITVGPKTKAFQTEFKNYLGCRYAIAVNSCTAGLHLGLLAAGIREGDEVITSTNTFAATSEVILHTRAKPVFVDIDNKTLNIDTNNIEASITKKTKAIVPVHFGGHPCEMDQIIEIADRYNLFIMEDAAHALGASYKNKKIGTIGDVTSFSFYATKNLTTGEGGMITTNQKKLAAKMELQSMHGINNNAWKRYSSEGTWYYEVVYPGFKYNMSDINAAIGLIQLKKFDTYQNLRKKYASIYNEEFKNLSAIEIPTSADHVDHAWHLYVIKLNLDVLTINRDKFIRELFNRNIGASVHFIPMHLHPYYKITYGDQNGKFPVAEDIYRRVISIPLYQKMNLQDLDKVISSVKSIIKKYKR